MYNRVSKQTYIGGRPLPIVPLVHNHLQGLCVRVVAKVLKL